MTDDLPRVRAAAPRDRDALLALWLDLIEHHRHLSPTYPSLPGLSEVLAREIRRALRGGRRFLAVAEHPSGLVGFLLAEIDTPSSGVAAPGSRWIHELYVVPKWRRRAVGRALVERAMEFFQKCGDVREARIAVRVEHGNRSALAFWLAHGFSERAHLLERPLG